MSGTRGLLLLFPLVALSVSVGCDAGGGGRPGTPRDGGAGDGSSTGCPPGTTGFICRGNQAVECLADGSEGATVNCPETDQVCVQGQGCAACRPGTGSCEGNQLLRCADDGSGFTPERTCDAELGEVCNPSAGACVSPCSQAAAAQSYIGCEYWPVTALNSQVDASFQPAVVVANPQSESVRVIVTRLGSGVADVMVPAGGVETIPLPWVPELKGTFQEERSTLIRGGAYRLRSSLPVTVYQFNPLEFQQGADFAFSNDASLLLPTHVLTGNYIALSHPTLLLERGLIFRSLSASPGFLTIVGASDSPVTVEVQFRGNVVASGAGSAEAITAYRTGQTGTFTLGAGDVLQLVADAPTSCAAAESDSDTTYCQVGPDYDLTGTEIRATGPVQVIGGHSCAFVPHTRWACDHLEVAVLPLETWGNESIVSKTVPPMGRTEPNIVRILSGADNNQLAFDPASVSAPRTLNRGEVLEFQANESFRVTGSGPILVAQLMVGQDFAGRDSAGTDGEGDPSLSIGIPSEQFRDQYTFLAPSSFPTNYVNITAPTGATITLDGAEVGGFEPVGATGFGVARVPITTGSHAVTGSQPFGIVVYGYARYTSYMYPGGLDLEQINLF